MKRLLTYVLIGAFLVATALMVYVYREYLGEDSDPTTENLSNPLINKRLNAVVLRIIENKANNLPQFEVEYADLNTEETARLRLDNQYHARIHVGDTLTKEQGEKLLLVYQKAAGHIQTVPID
ncbi:hypothetical protein [Spirosoma sp.]|uniref:hypothetical protein n=1 Tax=Spirosoma sp. TaxID=1899569 RepID=UPI003B3B8FDF